MPDPPTIVPYGSVPADDGSFILTVGNDGQFARFAALAGAPGLSADPRFAANAAPVRNREVLIPLIGNPLKMSKTPVTYAKAPPDLGANTGAVLARILGMTQAELSALAAEGVIDGELDV